MHLNKVAKYGFRLDCCLATLLAVWSALAWMGDASAVENSRPRRMIYNSDGGNIFIDKVPPLLPDDVNSYVDEVVGKGVTTYFICPNYCMPMSYPSQVTEMIGSLVSPEELVRIRKVGQETKTSTERAIASLHGLVEAGHDPIGLVVERARQQSLEVFITLRLNEIHEVDQPGSLLVTKFWREHPEWRVGKLGDEVNAKFLDIIGEGVSPVVAGWFPGALNFAVPEVRALRLAELRECCERYAIDGIDLDFQRFPIYFPQEDGRKHLETMNGWMREVRAMTREVGERRGRPLLVSARVLARPEQCLDIGLDPATWAREGLVDFLVVSHYLRNNFPLNIAQYRRIVPDEMPLYASIEVEQEADRYLPIARQLWRDGADGIMLFNFFTWREAGREPPFEIISKIAEPVGD